MIDDGEELRRKGKKKDEGSERGRDGDTAA